MKGRFIPPVARRQRNETHRERFLIYIALYGVNAIVVFTLRNQFVGAVIVVINFGIGERFLSYILR